MCVPLASRVRGIWLVFLRYFFTLHSFLRSSSSASFLLLSGRPQQSEFQCKFVGIDTKSRTHFGETFLHSSNLIFVLHDLLIKQLIGGRSGGSPVQIWRKLIHHAVYVIIQSDLHLLSLGVINLHARVLVHFSSCYGQCNFIYKFNTQRI